MPHRLHFMLPTKCGKGWCIACLWSQGLAVPSGLCPSALWLQEGGTSKLGVDRCCCFESPPERSAQG
jgi:hypothetical protein